MNIKACDGYVIVREKEDSNLLIIKDSSSFLKEGIVISGKYEGKTIIYKNGISYKDESIIYFVIEDNILGVRND